MSAVPGDWRYDGIRIRHCRRLLIDDRVSRYPCLLKFTRDNSVKLRTITGVYIIRGIRLQRDQYCSANESALLKISPVGRGNAYKSIHRWWKIHSVIFRNTYVRYVLMQVYRGRSIAGSQYIRLMNNARGIFNLTVLLFRR